MKTVAAIITGSEHDLGVLNLALAVARPLGAAINACHPRADPLRSLQVFADGLIAMPTEAMLNAVEEDAKERSSVAHAAYNSWRAGHVLCDQGAAAAHAFSTSWKEVTGDPAQIAAAAARLCDLAVVARPNGTRNEGSEIAEAMIFGSGRPVLLCPPVGSWTPPERIAMFWKGTREAALALAGALPLMAASKEVAVISYAETGDEQPDAAAAAAYLKSVGINARAISVGRSNLDAAEVLENAAREFGAGLIAMGAYGHSRTREFLIGGVTRHLSRRAGTPVLMAH